MKRFVSFLLLLSLGLSALGQTYVVDRKGVLRDATTREEITFFGINYTAHFAHAYRQLHRFGADIKQTIDKDTYHLARMGVTAYRIHVWDYEITDGEGNLLSNEHLDLFDYLIHKLEERGIRVVLTMILGGNNGYPEPGEDLPGFSGRMNKAFATSDPGAAVIEEAYIRNFLDHYNPYTGHQTKADPMIVGFEINNEPTNSTPPKETTAFVDRMIKAVRSTGCKKPVFYNVSHNFQNTQAFYDSKMDGGTFQWYPTGLVANYTRRGNFLPSVAEYKIPFDDIKGFDRKARLVYEFDAADQWAAYLYPAIVRSFREAGFQWVTFFAYDPIDIAMVNTEYQTHYLNLAYTPAKAISFKIAAEAMKALPRGTSYGKYPQSNSFGDFLVDYRQDLSVMNSGDKFYYTNTNDVSPKDAAALASVAGTGSSRIVRYEGTGAYFLDKVADGIWRLEVMPDQVLLSDPFAKASPHKEVNTILWHQWPMSIDLPDLGEGFSFREIDAATARQGTASGKTLEVIPGTWLLARRGVSLDSVDPDAKLGNIRINEFVAPGPRQKELKVLHKPTVRAAAGRELAVCATVIGPADPDSVVLYSPSLTAPRAFTGGGRARGPLAPPTLKMERKAGYDYQAVIPADKLGGASLNYYIITYKDGAATTWPGAVAGTPADWDFYNGEQSWTTALEPAGSPVLLYGDDCFGLTEAFGVDVRNVRTEQVSGTVPGTKATRLASLVPRTPPVANAPEAFRQSAEGEAFMRLFVRDLLAGRKQDLNGSNTLCIQLVGHEGAETLRAGFVTADGFSYKAEVPCRDGLVRIPLSSLKLVPTVIRPETYPGFLPDYFVPDPALAPAFRVQDIESLEVGLTGLRNGTPWSLTLQSCWLE